MTLVDRRSAHGDYAAAEFKRDQEDARRRVAWRARFRAAMYADDRPRDGQNPTPQSNGGGAGVDAETHD